MLWSDALLRPDVVVDESDNMSEAAAALPERESVRPAQFKGSVREELLLEEERRGMVFW
jgi:hypothetical protein